MDRARITRVRIALDPEEEVPGHQHRLDGELQALLDRLTVLLREIHEIDQRLDLTLSDRTAVGTAREVPDDLLHTGPTCARSTGENPLPRLRLLVSRERAVEDDAVQEFVVGGPVDLFLGKGPHELVVNEGCPED